MPELIQLQLLPQLAGQPTTAPLSRPPDLHLIQANMDNVVRQLWRSPILREKGHLTLLQAIAFQYFDAAAPSHPLGVSLISPR